VFHWGTAASTTAGIAMHVITAVAAMVFFTVPPKLVNL
jgi:hypothetical protein